MTVKFCSGLIRVFGRLFSLWANSKYVQGQMKNVKCGLTMIPGTKCKQIILKKCAIKWNHRKNLLKKVTLWTFYTKKAPKNLYNVVNGINSSKVTQKALRVLKLYFQSLSQMLVLLWLLFYAAERALQSFLVEDFFYTWYDFSLSHYKDGDVNIY